MFWENNLPYNFGKIKLFSHLASNSEYTTYNCNFNYPSHKFWIAEHEKSAVGSLYQNCVPIIYVWKKYNDLH